MILNDASRYIALVSEVSQCLLSTDPMLRKKAGNLYKPPRADLFYY